MISILQNLNDTYQCSLTHLPISCIDKVLLDIENETKNGLISSEKIAVMTREVRNVPPLRSLLCSYSFRWHIIHGTHRSMHWDIEISLSHLSHRKPSILFPLLLAFSCVSGWMHHHLVTCCCSSGESGALSPTVSSPVFPCPSSLLVVPVISHQLVTLAWCFLGARKWGVT